MLQLRTKAVLVSHIVGRT